MLDEYQRPFRLAREQRGWSLAEIANQLGVNRATVSRWERGLAVPHRVHRVRLEALFGKTAGELGLLRAFPHALKTLLRGHASLF